MLIDWFTVIAQVVNFLVLVLLLRLLLYKPITRAMQKRQEKIAERLEEGERKQEEAEAEAGRYREERRDLEESRASLLEEAKEEAAERRRRLLSEVREEVEAARERWRSSLEQQRGSFLDDLRERTATEVCEIARRALADLADADLESQMVKRFVERLKEMEADELERLATAVEESNQIITLRSRFELGEDLRDLIAESLEEHVGWETDLRFETAEDLVGGIELRIDGLKVAWNLDEYLETLVESVRQELAEESRETMSETEQESAEDERPGAADQYSAETEDAEAPGETESSEGSAESEREDRSEAEDRDEETETEEAADGQDSARVESARQEGA
jgi:F-type H+-transporting ATPase subunit b